ncbi:amidase [Pseudomonas tolaasii]|uniref:Amidase n=2 Tax=Pseudomonas tolaasii TaxID=29442 RepID=A0A7Y8AT90_PSETO|nr:amidase family protein [Pseudomonas tolaasii]ARB29231.1 amidase [Pseudomonas tolaasii]KAB0466689.1 amidase [Pseudomonas tolaasii]MBY8943645.1 amidase [Pseudomonas tolaasii]NWC24186.1 amidase [Pseudomonas tolaasii]NWC37685.1 amidase [Pseudomonas tolaasii]
MTPDSSYRSATELVADIACGRLSSRALLESCIARVEMLNPALNSIVALNLGEARLKADLADTAVRNGLPLGPLHGLPMTIKDTFEVLGMPCTAGATELCEHRPRQSAAAVKRLEDAGAIVFGKTNVPTMAGDIQTYNSLFGTTNNPWNLALTPGGSSGGAAVALAAGFTPLELGSDIGGSIRIPAHFTGVYGHKPTHGIVSQRGHIPGAPGELAEGHLNVVGPLARHAADLQLMLGVIAGGQAGWHVQLPAPRHQSLKAFRVLLWTQDADCPLASGMADTYRQLRQTLEAAGVDVVQGAPAGASLERLFAAYLVQLGAKLGVSLPAGRRRFMGLMAPVLRGLGKVMDMPRHADKFYEGTGMSHAEWLMAHEQGLQLREAFLKTFDDFDVILAPPTFTTAFAHDQSNVISLRSLKVEGNKRHYADLYQWIAPATLMGLPATSAPLGLTRDGLPVGIQIIGAPFEDRTTIKFAECLADVIGGFQIPPAMG